MSRAIQTPQPDSGLNLILFSIPQSFLLQIGTASILLLLTTQKASFRSLEALGEASEELFRGHHLPLLKFPDDNEPNQS
jgi:hypothetical protein